MTGIELLVAVCVGGEQARQDRLERQILHPRRDFDVGNFDRRTFRDRELLGEVCDDPQHDILGAFPIGIGEEEDRPISGHPEDRIVDAKRACDEVDHFGENQVAIRARHPHHHRSEAVIGGEIDDLVQQSPQFARVVALRLVEGHCHHDAWNIDETRFDLKPGIRVERVVGAVPIAYGWRPAQRESMHETPHKQRSTAVAARQTDARIALGFQGLVVLTFCLIVLGALVRAHGAGLACPDWPLCFGSAIPRIDLWVGLEWSHRLLAGSVTAIFAWIATTAWRSPGRSRYVSALLIVAAALIGVQILLGALTVWLQLAPWTVTAHLITGNSFASAVLLLALAHRAKRETGDDCDRVSTRKRIWITLVGVLLLIQLGLGGLVSSHYAGMACPEWPSCNGGVWFPTWEGAVGLHLFHRMTAYVLIVSLGVAALCCRRDRRLRGATALALSLGVLQASVGVASVRDGIPVELTGLHTALAAALVLTVVFALQSAWSAMGEPKSLSAR